MIFEKTDVEGAFIITQKHVNDERGYFSRVFCADEFKSNGINVSFVQSNICQNKSVGTLRGLHTQCGESAEDKLVACTRGRIYDVCADVRENSCTFGKYVGFELSEENGNMLFVPKGCAHGYITLSDDCQLLYFMSEYYKHGYSRGYMWDDPVFTIDWPLKPLVLSEQDSKWSYIDNM